MMWKREALKRCVVRAIIAAALGCVAVAQANTPPFGYDHARFAPIPADIKREFAAFHVSFDSKDDDNGDRIPDLRRIPEWVSQEIRRFEAMCVNTSKRPSAWFTDRALVASGVAPRDASYANSGFERGHLAATLLAARIGLDADRKTHTLLNTVPQFTRFKQIWRDLEDYTGAWAQVHGKIWVIQGPVFYDHTNTENARWIGDADQGERLVAVPDALFKVVVRDDESLAEPVALAFIYPQLGARYHGSQEDFAHERFLTTVEEIEELTGLTFTRLASVRSQRAKALWLVGQEDFIAGCEGSE